jgi:hypothetical protein
MFHLRLSNRSLWAGLALGLVPSVASAHVKWFEDAARFPIRAELAWSERTALWLGASALALLWLSLGQRLVGRADWPNLPIFDRMAAGAPTILAIQAAIGLVSAAVRPSLLASNLVLPATPLGIGLALLEGAIAAILITGIADWLGALMLLSLVPLTAVLYSPSDALDQLAWAGVAAALLVLGRHSPDARLARPWLERRARAWAPRGVALLRVGTGLALIAAALSEKLWNPALGAAFLADHSTFNVVHIQLGQGWFSDDLFVLAAGIVEGTIGIVLVSGYLTRIVVLAMWVPFNLGIPFLPAQELLGHLPTLGAMYILLVCGPGSFSLPLGVAMQAVRRLAFTHEPWARPRVVIEAAR